MKFALLGATIETWPLAVAAQEAGHEIVWLGDVVARPAEPPSLARLEDRGGTWEELLDRPDLDGVVVGPGDGEQRQRQMQELLRRGRAVLAWFPLFESVLPYFEIDLARSDGGALLQHFNSLATSPALAQLARLGVGDAAGKTVLEQTVVERCLADRSVKQVLRQFMQDVELLERCGGRFHRLAAQGPAAEATQWGTLSVQLQGSERSLVRWHAAPAGDGTGLHLTAIGAEKSTTAVLEAPGSPEGVAAAVAAAGAAIEQFAAAIRRQELAPPGGAAAVASRESTWSAALHAAELADAIELSLRRSRTIDIHALALTEEVSFKGRMAALGCAVLILLAPLTIVAGWIAGLLGVPMARYWPHALLILLALFLMLQGAVKMMFSKPAADSSKNSPIDSSGAGR